MYRNATEVGEAKSPFELKVKGDFEDALRMYALRYVESLESENAHIAEICFDQMFDICLLEYLKQGDRFESKSKLLEAVERRLRDVLSFEESDDRDEFKKSLDSCKRRLFPRGRSSGVFSVDPKWLLKTTQLS